MILNSKDAIIFALLNLSALLGRISSKDDGDFFCLNCAYSLRTKRKLEPHKKISNLK